MCARAGRSTARRRRDGRNGRRCSPRGWQRARLARQHQNDGTTIRDEGQRLVGRIEEEHPLHTPKRLSAAGPRPLTPAHVGQDVVRGQLPGLPRPRRRRSRAGSASRRRRAAAGRGPGATNLAGPGGAERRRRPTRDPDGARPHAARPWRPGPSPAVWSRRPAPAHATPAPCEPQPGRADERAGVPEPAGLDPRPPGESNPAELIHLLLGGREEGPAETQVPPIRSRPPGTGRGGPPPRRRRDRPTCPSAPPTPPKPAAPAGPSRPPAPCPTPRPPGSPGCRTRRRARRERRRCGRRGPHSRADRSAADRRSRSPRPRPSTRPWRCKSSCPAAAPTQPSPRASALASLSTNVGRPVSAARRDRRGNDRHPAMFSGDTSPPPGLIGPPQPAPQTTRRSPGPTWAMTPSTTPATVSHRASASPGPADAGVGCIARCSRVPSKATSPAAILVPPISTARARSATGGLLPRPGADRVMRLTGQVSRAQRSRCRPRGRQFSRR